MHLLYPLTTLSFAYPWVLFSPFAVFCFWYFRQPALGALLYPDIELLRSLGPSALSFFRTVCLRTLLVLFLILLTIAAARPQFVRSVEATVEAKNLMLAIDVSPSMSAQDFAAGAGRINRLQAVKKVVAQFVDNRSGDRIGLVVFGGHSYLQAPLTLDHDLLKSLVNRLEVGMAGDGTAIGDGLGLSIKRIEDLKESLGTGGKGAPAAVILLTDGVSNAGQVNPIKAAKVAADLGIKVHTIGIGSRQPITVQLPGGIFTQQIQTQSEFDEKTLREMANVSGGVYFNAENLEGLSKVYRDIDTLESTKTDEYSEPIIDELFLPYAQGALICYLVYLLLAYTIFLRVP